jgi:tRNA-Thr(GGU) m(6)t(6)A37 methyltransferase TsaA
MVLPCVSSGPWLARWAPNGIADRRNSHARVSPGSVEARRRPTSAQRAGSLSYRAERPGRSPRMDYSLRAIGHIRSTLRALEDAPRQGSEGAPDAWLEMDPAFERALFGIAEGDEVIVITWLHRANREVLETHPRNDPAIPLTGVFATRSPDRPNPLGLHRVTVREISGTQVRIGPIEAIDGTPVVDVKPVWGPSDA